LDSFQKSLKSGAYNGLTRCVLENINKITGLRSHKMTLSDIYSSNFNKIVNLSALVILKIIDMKNLILYIPFLLLTITSCHKEKEDPRTGRTTAVFNISKTYGSVKDIDGNEYKTITLGTQTWMAENLRSTHYQNGDPISNVKGETDLSQWGNLTTGAYCSYNNSSNADSIATFGFLYNGYAAIDIRNIAPAGWHVPTDVEWDTLETFVAAGDAETLPIGNGVAGGRLKEAGTLHFGLANKADNSSGFTALPGGERSTSYNAATYSSKFEEMGHFSAYYSSSSIYPRFLLMRLIVPDFIGISRNQIPISFGISVRCVKDN